VRLRPRPHLRPNNAERRKRGSLTPIDPRTGKPGKKVAVDDPYNMYFTPDGLSAIVVAEARHRLDFRDPQTMAMQYSIEVPKCGGINHAEFSIDGRYALFTCEFDCSLAKIDMVTHKVVGYLKLTMPATRLREGVDASAPGASEICSAKKGMPQDVRIAPDGKRFYVADMSADGVHVVDGDNLKQIGFIQAGLGTHGLYPSRDGRSLYITSRGTHRIHGKRRGLGGVAVLDFASGKIVARWPIPGGGSPDMGNVSRRQMALALGALRRRRVPDRYAQRRGSPDQGGRRTTRPDRVAAARPLLARPHWQPALGKY
jgi:DNA-binding beta-propeller fold protein YncE